MYVLGISCYYHDAAACLIKNNKIIAAAEEERFTRKKHDTSFPLNAINYCLEHADITNNEIDYIGYYEKPLLKFERLLKQHVDNFPKSYWTFYKAMPSWIVDKLRIQKKIRKELKYKKDIFYIDHHKSHAASCYLLSPFKKSAILTMDGVGEFNSITLGYGSGNDIKIIKEIHFPHSLGLLYSTITTFLGFKANNGEGKIMGLAAYGNPDKYYHKLKKLISVNDNGSFSLNMDYFDFDYKLKMFSKKLVDLLGKNRKPNEKLRQRHMDIAATLQKITEEIVFNILNHLHKITKSINLCYSGGLALNSVLNGKIIANTPFKKIFIQPAAGDSGSALGCAAYVSTKMYKKRPMLENTYLGPRFSLEEVKDILDKNNMKYKEINDNEIIKKTAKLIYQNKIIAWFQGRMEFGPRALGNRSILANPCNPKMKDIINHKVKFRESFRPFAPVVCYENLKEYFEGSYEVPYMLHVFKVKSKKIPSVTHIDGTGRLQTVKREQNKRYYDLIKEFQKISSVPVLLNTSFNVRGEPIVCTPQNALDCFLSTGIDYLVFENVIVWNKKNSE